MCILECIPDGIRAFIMLFNKVLKFLIIWLREWQLFEGYTSYMAIFEIQKKPMMLPL